MCFSASASFVASGGLAVVGAATLHVAPKRRRLLALIPFAFAVQQAFEGVQWLYLDRGTTCAAAGYGYTFLAFAFWPIFIPSLVYTFDRAGRPLVKWFLGLGIVVGLWNLFALGTGTLTITVASSRIAYWLDVTWGPIGVVLYVLALCGSLFASRIRAFRWFGLVVLATAVTSYVWFRPGFPSVWCYFAALLSGLVFFYAARHQARR